MRTIPEEICRSFGCTEEETARLPESIIAFRKTSLSMFERIDNPRLLAIWITAKTGHNRTLNDILEAEDHTAIFTFYKAASNCLKSNDIAFADEAGNVILLQSEQIVSIKPVSFDADYEIFRIETEQKIFRHSEDESEVFYLSVRHTARREIEFESDLRRNIGLNRELYEIDGFDSFRNFVTMILSIQQIAEAEAAGMICEASEEEVDTVHRNMIKGIVLFPDSVVFMRCEAENLVIERDGFEEICSCSILDTGMHYLEFTHDDQAYILLADGRFPERDEEDDEEDEEDDIETIEGCTLAMIAVEGTRQFRQIYHADTYEETVEKISEEGSAEDILEYDPKEGLKEMHGAKLLEGLNPENFVIFVRIENVKDLAALIAPYYSDPAAIISSGGLEEIISHFNECALFEDDLSAQEKERLRREFHDMDYLTYEYFPRGLHSLTLLEQADEALELLDDSRMKPPVVKALKESCKAVEVTSGFIIYEACLSDFMLPILVQYTKDIEIEINRIMEQEHPEGSRHRRICFTDGDCEEEDLPF